MYGRSVRQKKLRYLLDLCIKLFAIQLQHIFFIVTGDLTYIMEQNNPWLNFEQKFCTNYGNYDDLLKCI